MKQEFLMLAHTFKKAKHNIGGWLMSEKLDGSRAFWDGGLSRRLPASEVPYANTVKDARYIEPPIATGLWTRRGKVIYAPNWWLDTLPSYPLDGELFMGYGRFQELRSIVASLSGGEGWRSVKFKVFDSPPYEVSLHDRTVRATGYEFKIKDVSRWEKERWQTGRFTNLKGPHISWTFEHILVALKQVLEDNAVAEILEQERLPLNYFDACKRVDEKLNELVAKGGEGVMLRNPISKYVTQRSHNLLKHKPWFDAEGTVTGFTSGRRTDKGSKHLGRIGALILDFKGKRLELSGLTDKERSFTTIDMNVHARSNPGKEMPYWFNSVHFKVGDTVTFKYRELSDDGIPKEARYWRKNV